MGTEASITRHINTVDGVSTYEQITVHWNGYPGGVGKILFENYNTEELVIKLIAGGSISSLEAKIFPDGIHPHSFDNPQEDVTVYYYRDRGDDWKYSEPRHIIREGDPTCPIFCEYNYLFKDGKWFYNSATNEEFRPLEKKDIYEEA